MVSTEKLKTGNMDKTIRIVQSIGSWFISIYIFLFFFSVGD